MRRFFFFLLLIALVTNCENENTKKKEFNADRDKQKITLALKTKIERGRMVYFANCVSCHNNNPKMTGSLGPELHGVTIEVLTRKIISGLYPKSYIPKRTSRIMPIMPHLNKEIINLHAFLNSS